MSLIVLLVILVGIGIALHFLNPYIDAGMKPIIYVVIVIVLVVTLLQAFGVWGYLSQIRIGH